MINRQMFLYWMGSVALLRRMLAGLQAQGTGQ